jgi:AbrB family looped-hinge helix DNA binding protein
LELVGKKEGAMVTRLRGKGQVTIPASIREALDLTEDSVLSVCRVGDGILMVPRPSVYESVSAKFSKTAEKEGITLKDLLEDLKSLRRKG